MKPSLNIALALLSITAFGATRLAAQDAAGTVKPAATPAAKPAAAAITLKIGDAAPELKVGEWYKAGPVKIEADKNYIIECWATWCGPCVAVFPHLSELAKANKDKLTVIGVNVWERKTPAEVKDFVAAQGDKMSYNVVADADGAVAQNWLKAAGRNGIPCAFIVSKGKIAWIGHPGSLQQELLTSILDGTCDIAALAKADAQKEAAGKYFQEHVMPSMAKKDYAEAVVQLEAMKKEFPGEGQRIDTFIDSMKKKLAETPKP